MFQIEYVYLMPFQSLSRIVKQFNLFPHQMNTLFVTAQKMKFSIKDFFRRIWSHLPKKFLMEKFIFYAVSAALQFEEFFAQRFVFQLMIQGQQFKEKLNFLIIMFFSFAENKISCRVKIMSPAILVTIFQNFIMFSDRSDPPKVI